MLQMWLVFITGILLLTGLVLFPPRWLLRLINSPRLLTHVNIRQKYVALTFDDGPDESTHQLLDCLKKLKVVATFFVIGKKASRHSSILNRIHREGHWLGNHDWTDRMSARVPVNSLVNEVERTQEIIDTVQGSTGRRYFRPGCGIPTPVMLTARRNRNYVTTLGDCYPWDSQIPSVSWMIFHVLTQVKPGSIIILHEGHPKRTERTRQALQVILPTLRRRGYQFVTLPQLEEIKLKSS